MSVAGKSAGHGRCGFESMLSCPEQSKSSVREVVGLGHLSTANS